MPGTPYAFRPTRVRTVAGLAPLISGKPRPGRLQALPGVLASPRFAGRSDLERPLLLPIRPDGGSFGSRSYWRGPTRPVVDGLLWWALPRAGEEGCAAVPRRAALDKVSEGRFAEDFEPRTGEPLGSDEQSCTAAVVLGWLAAGTAAGAEPQRGR